VPDAEGTVVHVGNLAYGNGWFSSAADGRGISSLRSTAAFRLTRISSPL
jgi:hypothetical protein